MRRLSLSVLAIWLALCGAAHASAWHRNYTTVFGATSATFLTVPTPAYQSGNTITLCVTISNATPSTVWPSGFVALTGTGLPAVGSSIWANCAIKTAGSEPTSYTVSWTGGATARLLAYSVENTDGSTPAVDIAAGTFANSANNINPASVTTTQNSDVVDNVVVAGWFLNAASPPASGIFGDNKASQYSVLLQSFGQPVAGATLVDNVGAAGAGAMTAITIAWKNNTTTAALETGVGADSFNSGSSYAVSPGYPSNFILGSSLFTEIYTATTGLTILPPGNSDIQLRILNQNYSTTNTSSTLSVPLSNVVNGDQMIAFVEASKTTTINSCISNSVGWTKYLDDDTQGRFDVWTKTATTGDVGATLTCTGSANDFYNLAATDWYALSGNPVTIEANSGVTNQSTSTTSFTLSNVTTLGINRLILASAWQDIANTISWRASVTPLTITGGHGLGVGYYPQASTGTSVTPTMDSTGSKTWQGAQIALTSGGSTGALWNLVAGPLIDPTSTNEVSLYSHIIQSTTEFAQPFAFSGSSSASEGLTSAFNNLDTTTPIDRCASLGMNKMVSPVAPAYTPTQADELVLMGGAPVVTFGQLVFGGSKLAMGYGPLSLAGANNGASLAGTVPFVTFKCGLKAATTPTRTSTVSHENQVMLMIATTALPIPVAGASLFELEVP